MSIPNLPVNFKDDILASSNTKRKYQQTFNSDGSMSLEDVTQYTQKGSEFGASQVNQTNGAVNNIYDERIVDVEDLSLVTESGFFVDALAIKEINADLAELSSVEAVTLKKGVILTRCGKLRILQCVNASSPEAGNIVDVPAADVPDTYVMASAAYKGQQRGDYFLSLSPTNKKVGLYYGGDNPQAVPGDYIVGQLVWCI